MKEFKNPGYQSPDEARYAKYKPYIDEFLNSFPAEKEFFTFDDVRDYFAGHKVPDIAALAAEMKDGLLDDLCQRHGLQPSL